MNWFRVVVFSFTLEIFTFQKSLAQEWIPKRPLSKPFITFVNDLTAPSWMTTNNKTLRQTVEDVLVPSGLNFGAICVGCIGINFYSSVSLTIIPPKSDTFIVKKIKYENDFFQVGENGCIAAFTIFPVLGDAQKLYCNFSVDYETHQLNLTITPEKYGSPDTTHKLIRKVTNLTSETVLDCKKPNVNFSVDTVETTLWWYESKGEILTPFHVSKRSEYPSETFYSPPSTIDTIGCVTYEIKDRHVFGAYETRFLYDGTRPLNTRSREKHESTRLSTLAAAFSPSSTPKGLTEKPQNVASCAASMENFFLFLNSIIFYLSFYLSL